MSWQEDMERDAVRVAFPDWELRDDDAILFDVDYDPGYHYSSYTYEDPSFSIIVSVRRLNDTFARWNEYFNEEAREFFIKLMNQGSQ